MTIDPAKLVQAANEQMAKALKGFVGRPVNPDDIKQALLPILKELVPELTFNFEAQGDHVIPADARTAYTLALLNLGVDVLEIRSMVQSITDHCIELVVPGRGRLSWSPDTKETMGFQPEQACEYIDIKFTV